MSSYTIFRHHDGRIEAAAQGVSLAALLVPPVWLAAQRLWVAAAAWILLAAALAAAYIKLAMHQSQLQPIHIALAIGLAAMFLVPAIQGRSWVAGRLLGLGFEPVGQVEAETVEAAISQHGK